MSWAKSIGSAAMQADATNSTESVAIRIERSTIGNSRRGMMISVHRHSFALPYQGRVLLADLANFGDRNGLNIRLIGIETGVILVVVLGRIKLAQRFERGDDRTRKGPLFVQCENLRFCDPLFVLVGEKNGGAVLRSNVVPLAIELCGIVGVEEHAEQGLVADF